MIDIIEPCCAERQLPALLREQKGRAALFQTYGDVTFGKLLKSVSCMAGDDHLTMTLAVREVTGKMRRTLQDYQNRQWITTLRVLTDDLNGEVICIEGNQGTVIIQGPVIDTAQTNGRPVLYAGQFVPKATDITQLSILNLLSTRYRRQASLADDADGAGNNNKSNRKTKKQ